MEQMSIQFAGVYRIQANADFNKGRLSNINLILGLIELTGAPIRNSQTLL